MGVYIPKLKKPKNCNDCEFRNYDWADECPFTEKRIDDEYEPNSDCPLIEVTEPHGDLIDRKRIDYKNYKMHDGRGNLIVSDTFVDGVTWVNNCIYDTPTVIEREGE